MDLKTKQDNAFFTGTIRRQLAWSFGSVALIIMLGLAGLLFDRQRDFLYRAAIQQSKSLATSLASSSSSWVLANDIAGLKEVLHGVADLPDLERAYILSLRGEVLSSTRDNEAGLFATDTPNQNLLNSPPKTQVLLANSRRIDVASPVMTGSRHVGWARVEMTMRGVNANLRSIIIMGVNFIVFAALTVLAAAIMLARRLTKRLRHLMRVTAQVEQGNLNVRTHISGSDEVGILAHGFNQMLGALAHSERQRERTNQLYAAWTQCADIIVRESDEIKLLNEVCRIIAHHVAFKLIWVGMTDADGWIRLVATSRPDSNYLKNIKISVDGALPEGHGPMGSAIRDGAPKICNHFLDDPATLPWQASAAAENIDAAAAFPLMRGGRCVGAIAVYSEDPGYFTPDLIGLMRGLTDDLSYALDNFDREQLRLNAEHELRIAAAAFDSQEGILVTDANGVILRINKSFTELTGYSAEEIIGQSTRILKSDRQDRAFYATMWECINRDRYWQGEIWNKRKNGLVYPEWLCITAITNAEGSVTHYVGTFTDISQRKADEERIKNLAYYDSLTTLPNRTLLFDRLKLALNTSKRNKTHGALMFLDLDNFKALNDTLGHDRGDQLLIEVGRRLQSCVREADTVARLGGDEFVVMLEFLDQQRPEAIAQAHAVAEKIRSSLAELYLLKSGLETHTDSFVEHYSTGSIGFVLFMGHETSSEELLKRADLAMYQAKQAGRNTIRAFVPEMQDSLNLRTALETDLRNALERNELSLHYQVQVNVSGQAVGAEALIRWNQTERGMISPAEFIPLAEETGLILPIGAWVLRQGCETLIEWAKYPETRHLKLAVNISSRQLNQDDFAEQVLALLAETGINPARLKLEITESVVVDNVNNTIAKMQEVRKLGVNFSMDDFGTGYSSLSYLQKLPLEQLKIDQSFVRNMAFNNHDSAIIRTILALGQNLALNVIAEGVETEIQRDSLTQYGCRVFQGYLFGRPMPAEQFRLSLPLKQTEEAALTEPAQY
ncbi:MAG: EAL domain-containing protein [Methylobacter sp.]|nr:EAL domain-containing protein [Methylobacter sp.]MDP2426715.1 EAL domain-containing protein [Methylobacter sp.]MDP3054735.1 EAL domain-containing protein [Methylobacter sp.]MDP3361787.1 EAL domain-containing protein [Methylobacter sp.]MDZ4219532.1 EAL domain-containing protein [Methylobacter sp.]